MKIKTVIKTICCLLLVVAFVACNKSASECHKACSIELMGICGTPPLPGPEGTYYFYSKVTNSCEEYVSYGYEEIPFYTLEECQACGCGDKLKDE